MREARSSTTVLPAEACTSTSQATPPPRRRWCSGGWCITTRCRADSVRVNDRFIGSIAVIAAVSTCVILLPSRNWAQNNELNIQFHGFDDARGVTVLSPTVDLSQDYTDRTSLRI